MTISPAPVNRLVGRYFTAHTWAKNNRLELDVSQWFNECIKPLLEAEVIMPKRFMLYMDAQFPELWRRIRHDNHILYDESMRAMDGQAAFNYARTIQKRREPNVRDHRAGPDDPSKAESAIVAGSGESTCWADLPGQQVQS